MICIASFIVLSILGLFSATHRKLAREAFDCVARRVTLRPCNTGFDTKIKAKILGTLIPRSPALARFVKRRFEIVAWVFMVLVVVSGGLALRGVANYYFYGSCNGLNKSGFCVFDPNGENNKTSLSTEAECRLAPPSEKDLTLKGVNLSLFPTRPNAFSDKTLLFIGCYNCDYTRKVYPLIQKLLKKVDATYIFAHFPTKEETAYLSNVGWCAYRANPTAYWQLNDRLFASSKENVASPEYVKNVLDELGFNGADVMHCAEGEDPTRAVAKELTELKKIGVYGTPTIFLNGTPVVGPKPYRVYRRLLQQSLL